jgi:hypothetical protein
MRFELVDYQICSFCQDLAGERNCAFVAQNEFADAEVNERIGGDLARPFRSYLVRGVGLM